MHLSRSIWVCFRVFALAAALALSANGKAIAAGNAALAKVLEAVGGPTLLDEVKTLVVIANSSRATPSGVIKTETTSYYMYPIQFRQEIRAGSSQFAMLSTPSGAFLVTGDRVVELSPADRQSIEVTALRNLVTLLKARHGRFFAVEPGKPVAIDGRQFDTLRISVREEATTLVVDRVSGRVVRQVYALPANSGGEEGTMTVDYSDYSEVAPGLTLPKRARGSLNGSFAFESSIETVKVNVDIAPEKFAPVPMRGSAFDDAASVLRGPGSQSSGSSPQSPKEKP